MLSGKTKQHKKSSAVQPPSSQLLAGSKWHSVALLELLLSNTVEMRRQLHSACVRLLPLRVAEQLSEDERPCEYHNQNRLCYPNGDAELFEQTDLRVELNLSQWLPGLLSLFVRSTAGVIATNTRLADLTGVYMLDSEHAKFEDVFGHEMGTEVVDNVGCVPTLDGTEAVDSGLIMVGDPCCPASHVLHSDGQSKKRPKPNCKLFTNNGSDAVGAGSMWLQSCVPIQAGSELFINYDDDSELEHFAVSCFICHLRIADEEQSDPKTGFRCLGFINASPCPRIVHRACAVKSGVVGDYCHFCAIESGKDDDCMHPSAQQIMRLVPVECDTSPSQEAQQYASDVGCVIHSNLSFAAVLHFACGEGFDVVHAKPVDGESYTPIKATERKKYCCTRIIEYRLRPQPDTDGEPSYSLATGESQLSLHSDIDSDYCSVASTLRSASAVDLSLSLIGIPGWEGFGSESELESDEDATSDDGGESEYTGFDLPTNDQNSTTFAEGYAAFRRGAGAAADTPAASLRGMLLDAGVPMFDDDAVDELSDISWKSEDFVRHWDDSDDDYSDTRHCNVRTRSHK